MRLARGPDRRALVNPTIAAFGSEFCRSQKPERFGAFASASDPGRRDAGGPYRHRGHPRDALEVVPPRRHPVHAELGDPDRQPGMPLEDTERVGSDMLVCSSDDPLPEGTA